MTGPVVSAHEDGDDLAGVPLRSCASKGCPVSLVSGDRCPRHTLRPKAPRRNASQRADLALAALHQRGTLTTGALADLLGCSAPKAGEVLYRLACTRKPALAIRLCRGVCAPKEAP